MTIAHHHWPSHTTMSEAEGEGASSLVDGAARRGPGPCRDWCLARSQDSAPNGTSPAPRRGEQGRSEPGGPGRWRQYGARARIGFWVNAPQIFVNDTATVSRRGASDRDRAGLQKGRQASAPGRHAARAWLLLASPNRVTAIMWNRSETYAVLISVITTLSRDAALLAFEISIDFRHHRVALASRYLHVCHTK